MGRTCETSSGPFLAKHGGRAKVLYDTPEMTPPPVDVPWAQREMDAFLGDVRLRRAIAVSDSKLEFLARRAFGEADYRVFYNDIVQAIE